MTVDEMRDEVRTLFGELEDILKRLDNLDNKMRDWDIKEEYDYPEANEDG